MARPPIVATYDIRITIRKADAAAEPPIPPTNQRLEQLIGDEVSAELGEGQADVKVTSTRTDL